VDFLRRHKIALKLAWDSLLNNKRRTALSVLGVVIGVMLVIVVLSLGAGMKKYVVDQIESFGSDIINVEVKVPGTAKTSSSNAGGIASGTEIKTLDLDDAEEIVKLNNIKNWYAGIMNQAVASFRDKNETVMIMGVTAGVFEVDGNLKIKSGQEFDENDDKGQANVVVIGSEAAKNLFGNRSAVGQKIKLGNQRYEVKGVLEERGASGVFDFDSIVYVPMRTVQSKMLNIDHVQWIIFKTENQDKDKLTIKMMESILRDNHNIDDPEDDDFAITSMAEATEIIDQVFGVLNILLIGLTSISLLVGGVGIMNVMYVAVTERTFEIGLRKAIGAKKKDILWQFVYEALILTLIGGLAGILLGSIFSKIAELVAGRFDFVLDFPVTSFSVILALGFSVLTGVVFGYKPAKKASGLTAIEAIRENQ
jgi:putative ABC transport system permease protein